MPVFIEMLPVGTELFHADSTPNNWKRHQIAAPHFIFFSFLVLTTGTAVWTHHMDVGLLWLWHEKVLIRDFEFREKMQDFSTLQGHRYAQVWANVDWADVLAELCLNRLNMKI